MKFVIGFYHFPKEDSYLKKGLSIELIAEVTKLDEKEIFDLKGTL